MEDRSRHVSPCVGGQRGHNTRHLHPSSLCTRWPDRRSPARSVRLAHTHAIDDSSVGTARPRHILVGYPCSRRETPADRVARRQTDTPPDARGRRLARRPSASDSGMQLDTTHYPACRNQPGASDMVTVSNASAIACAKASRVRAACARKQALILDQHASIGEQSGAEGGRERRRAPAAASASATPTTRDLPHEGLELPAVRRGAVSSSPRVGTVAPSTAPHPARSSGAPWGWPAEPDQ